MKKHFEIQPGFNMIPGINSRVFLATEENTGKEFFAGMIGRNGVLFTLMLKKDQWLQGEYIEEDEVVIVIVDLLYELLRDEELMAVVLAWDQFIGQYRNLYNGDPRSLRLEDPVDECYKKVAKVTGKKPLLRATISEVVALSVASSRERAGKPMGQKIGLWERLKCIGDVISAYRSVARIIALQSVCS